MKRPVLTIAPVSALSLSVVLLAAPPDAAEQDFIPTGLPSMLWEAVIVSASMRIVSDAAA